jgi:excisionase family DNA binding protein
MTASPGVRHLTIAELAEREGVEVETVYAWNSRGTGPRPMGRGRGRRYRLADVEAWEESRLSPAPARMTAAQTVHAA